MHVMCTLKMMWTSLLSSPSSMLIITRHCNNCKDHSWSLVGGGMAVRWRYNYNESVLHTLLNTITSIICYESFLPTVQYQNTNIIVIVFHEVYMYLK